MTVNNDFIDRILEGAATKEESVEFQTWLQTPANLERFTLRAELHSDLRRSLRRRDIQDRALEVNAGDPIIESASSREELPSPVFRSRGMLVLTVTGLVTAACILVSFIGPEGNGDPVLAESSVATVVSNVNGLLWKSDQRWDDAKLPLGEYELQEGLFHLQFGGGVMVYLEAPARFDAVSDSRVVLHNGRLSAKVPPAGIGFTVETPEAEVVDFGTEFSVDVEGGASEVHVFDGLVRVSPGTSHQRDVFSSVDLEASQAVRITDGIAKYEDISIATDRFIRNFDEPKWSHPRLIKRLSPLASYRMPIRDHGLVSEPPEHSGIVLTGEGKRPPHARGAFLGGSLRVGADSTGRGGRVDSPPKFGTGQFSLTAFVYLEAPAHRAIVVTNLDGIQGNFGLSLEENGMLQAHIKKDDGEVTSITGGSVLPLKTWRHIVMTADGQQLNLYEDGELVASLFCAAVATSVSDKMWFGTDAGGTQVWDGRIDEVALFDRGLSQEEVAALYRTAQEEIARAR